jgi:hypothetical protein
MLPWSTLTFGMKPVFADKEKNLNPPDIEQLQNISSI